MDMQKTIYLSCFVPGLLLFFNIFKDFIYLLKFDLFLVSFENITLMPLTYFYKFLHCFKPVSI